MVIVNMRRLFGFPANVFFEMFYFEIAQKFDQQQVIFLKVPFQNNLTFFNLKVGLSDMRSFLNHLMFQTHFPPFIPFFPHINKYQAKMTKFMASDYCVPGICAFVTFPPKFLSTSGAWLGVRTNLIVLKRCT